MMSIAIAPLLLLANLAAEPASSSAKPAAPAVGTRDPGLESGVAAMRRLHAQRQWRELVERFESEDFANWPADQAAEGLRLRGAARAALKDGQKAAVDLKAAIKLAPRSEAAWHALAENYSQNLRDDRQALTAYGQILMISGRNNGWLSITATLETARILTEQVKPDEAVQALDAHGDPAKMAPTWRIRILRAYGHAYAAQGDEQASLDKFREALKLESASP
jgi:tetratricopeptide (TPR) repeat protein